MILKGIDYEEIGNKLTDNQKPDDIEAHVWVSNLINSENFPILKEFLDLHIQHLESCHSTGAKPYLGIYKAISNLWVEGGSADDNFNFIKATLVNLPMMWC